METVNDITLDEWLRLKLEEKGWSYRALGRRSGVSYATISNIINHPEIKPEPLTIVNIAKALDADEGTLLNMAGYDVPQFNPDMPVPEQFIHLLNKLPEEEKTQR